MFFECICGNDSHNDGFIKVLLLYSCYAFYSGFVEVKVYLVGGAVRDQILGRRISDRDWVVVGSNPAEMIEAGYKRVGSDFPVFLHPTTNEEYALARTERKIGYGHTDFECYAGSDVTLEDDLRRRDLTINAVAQSLDGEIIDPYGGQLDIDRKLLRHVSPAFIEDPLRVYRIARFAAVLPSFSIVEETFELVRGMASAVQNLPGERIWGEWKKAAIAQEPWRFFEIIRSTGAVVPWFEGLDLNAVSGLFRDRDLRGEISFSAIGWVAGLDKVLMVCERLKTPRLVRSVGGAVAKWGHLVGLYRQASAADLEAAFRGIGVYKQGKVCEQTLSLIGEITGNSLKRTRFLAKGARNIKLSKHNLSGEAYGEALTQKRIEFIANNLGQAD